MGESDAGIIGLDCPDVKKFNHGVRCTSQEIFAIVDRLAEAKQRMKKTPFEKLQTDEGFTIVPNGLLLDMPLRRIYKPIEHTIRDWQHTLCSDGVGNTLIRQVLLLILPFGFSLQHVITFMECCQLPHKYGSVRAKEWLGKNRVKADTISSFSSIILSLIVLLQMFLDKFCSSIAELSDVCRMHYLFHLILGVLSTGPEEAPLRVGRLRKLTVEFHRLFALLSNSLKPKLHHFHHIFDGIDWLGKCLSCFVTERKHRCVKDSALHVFRHLEHTVLADIVNKQCHQFANGVDLFSEHFLHNPKPIAGAENISRSDDAVLHCGHVHRHDICWFQDATCGRAHCFYELDSTILIDVFILSNLADEPSMLDETRQTRTIIPARRLVDACCWFYDRPGVIKIIIPPIVLVTPD